MPRFVPSFLKNAHTESDDPVSSSPFPPNHQHVQRQEYVQEQKPSRFGVSRFGGTATATATATVTANSLTTKNRFEPLKYVKNTIEEQEVHPKKQEEPKMKPMTMAELTSTTQAIKVDSDGFTTVSSKKKAFADKFKDNKREEEFGLTPIKKLGMPNISLPKINSFEEFPSLGGTPKSGINSPKKTPTATTALYDMDSSSPNSTGMKQSISSSSFANLAKGWAKKTEDEAVTAELERLRGEKEKQEEEAFCNNIRVFNRFGKKKQEEEFFDDEDEPQYEDENAFEDEDDYEVPSGEEDLGPSDEDGSDYDPNYEHNHDKEYEERF